VGRDRPAALHRALASNARDVGGFHDFDDYERVVEAAKATDRRTYLIVLLGARRVCGVAR
jgi:hypothetical protein